MVNPLALAVDVALDRAAFRGRALGIAPQRCAVVPGRSGGTAPQAAFGVFRRSLHGFACRVVQRLGPRAILPRFGCSALDLAFVSPRLVEPIIAASIIYVAIEKQGVVTRPFAGEGIRVTIGTPAENDRFLETLASVVE